MKYLLLVLSLVVLQANSATTECYDDQHLAATYQVSMDERIHEHFVLWRKGQTVAHQSVDKGVVDVWYQAKNQRIKLTRLFPNYQRGLEYEPSEVRINGDWQSLVQKFSPDMLKDATKINDTGVGCQRVEVYVAEAGEHKIEMHWLPEYKLASKVILQQGKNNTVWAMEKLTTSKAQINAQFANWSDYQLTDYADVGDNESDPFLSKMINLGFVSHGATGFYDANGNQMPAEHSHHHH